MAAPWICIGPNVPQMLLRVQIAGTLDPGDAFYRRRIGAIDFSIAGFAVSPARLRGVGEAVLAGRIGVRVGDTGTNFAAAYTMGPDRHFTLGESNVRPSDGWRAQIVHEAVHAVFDLAGERPPVEIDEAAAYLAETVFFRAGGLGRTVRGDAAVVAIFTAASETVERLHLHTKPAVRLRRADIESLIAAINGHPGYRH